MRNVILARLGQGFEITGAPVVANVGDAYSVTFGTTGGTSPIAWTHSSLGSSGATFNDSTGVLSSAALTAGGSFPFTLTATDANRQFATADFVLIVLGSGIALITEDGLDDIVTESGELMVAQ